MTSVDSGIETSNESNDSCVSPTAKSLDGSIKTSPANVTPINGMTNSCNVNIASPSPSVITECDLGKFQNFNITLPENTPLNVEYELPNSGYSALPTKCFFASRTKMRRRLCSRRFKHDFLESKLIRAVSINAENEVAALLERGVDPNCSDHLQRTPLHLAACRKNSNIVRMLLENGANPNKRDAIYNTPLHLAACTNHVEVVTLLLRAGTNVSSNDFFGRNALQLAQSKLRLLQNGSNTQDSSEVKEKVRKVIEMMFTFLQKRGQDSDAELLSAFERKLNISQTKEEVETDIRDILANINSLSLNKSEG